MPDPAARRPFGFFVHHQGRGHAKRCEAILAGLDERPITIFCADPSLFQPETLADPRVTMVELPDHIGDPSETPGLFEQATPDVMHCVPMGSVRMRENAALFMEFFARDKPGLFFVDVSAEWAMLARLASVPAVSVRMHGDRNDPGHIGAYQASAGMVAPFHESIEQADYPAALRARTFYSGGLCTTTAPVLSRSAARAKLGLDDREMILTLSGGGGSGANYASLTMGARALPQAQWHTIGPLHREGHETDFANLVNHEWVDNPIDWIAAADVVIASAGDNTVHEIARVGRPYLCVPEWRYFDEQVAKARELARVGAAHTLSVWPGSNSQWRMAVANTKALEPSAIRPLFDEDAGEKIATHLIELDARLWAPRKEKRDNVVPLADAARGASQPASPPMRGAVAVAAEPQR